MRSKFVSSLLILSVVNLSLAWPQAVSAQQMQMPMPDTSAPSTPVITNSTGAAPGQQPVVLVPGATSPSQPSAGTQAPAEAPKLAPVPCYPPGSQGAVPLSQALDIAARSSQAQQQQVLSPDGAAPALQLGQVTRNAAQRVLSAQAAQQQRAIPCKYTNAFQEFVALSTGNVLPVFGAELFQAVPSTFAPVDHISVPADYVIGPGDELRIQAWGQIDIDYTATVDRSGSIYIPRVGHVRVAGLRHEELRNAIREAIGRVYRDFDLEVALGQLRTIQVFVVGQAMRPGAYTIGSLSTLVDAVFAAGGPGSAGSMRDIELRRGKQAVAHFDLYDLLLRGDKSADVKLLPGDVIYFNTLGPLVAMNGSVNAPAIFELRGQQSLQEVLQLAGGLTAVASSQKATVDRVENRKLRHVEELALDYDGLSRALKNADIVTVHSISGQYDNSVLLRGNVLDPGRYPWREGMRIKDLLPSYESLISRDYWAAKTATARQATSGASVGLGAIKNEIVRISPEINWDYAVVERLNTDELSTFLLPFNLRQALTAPDSADNMLLHTGDVVTIFSQDDLRVPEAKRAKFIYLEGEFKAGGVYRAEPGETLRTLVERVGLTNGAYLFGAEFQRVSAKQQQQVQLAAAIQSFEGEVERNAQIRLASALNPNDPAVLQFQQSLQNQRRIVAQMKQIVPTGRVVLDIKPASESAASLPDVVLEDGDRFIVPARPAIVSVIGAVNANTSLLHTPGLRAGDYLRMAGGPTRFADTRHMFIVRANGAVISQRGWTGTVGNSIASSRLMPGDTLVVPEELDHGAFMRGLKDWSQILGQLALGAAAIKVLRQ